ncbi:MAG: hypothetical protein C0403_05455 [Desulfobacterium sp.]|nr:hypothetical protein [Desulfobacterium sp.]
MKLSKKIILITITVLFVSLSISSAVLTVNFKKNYTEAILIGTYGIGHSLNSIVTELLSLGLPIESFTGMDKKCRQLLENNAYVSYVGIADINGEMLYHSDPAVVGKVFADDVMKRSIASLKPLTQSYKRFDGPTYYDLTIPIIDSANAHRGLIRIGFRTSVISDRVLSALLQVILIFSLSFTAIVLLINYFMSRFVSRPVINVSEHAKKIAYGDYDVKLAVTTNDEVGILADSVNQIALQVKQKTHDLETAKDHLEELVDKRTADLRAANEDLKKFTYIVSHDMRAPLINIKGFSGELRSATDTIQSAVEELIPFMNTENREAVRAAIHEDVPEALAFIATSVTRMDSLINSILKLSRLGHRDLTFEPIDMNDLVQNILKSIAHQIEERHVRVNVESLPEVTADRISMEHILGNLLDNAIKYLSQERAGEIRIWGEQGEKVTTFHIQDNGKGIAEQDIPKIFEIFNRLGVQDVPGEGMGLAYVQTVVRRHGGHIRWASEPGMGTTFTFIISKKLVNGGTYEY